MQELLEKAIGLRSQGKHSECLAILQELLTHSPDNANLNYQMAWVHDNLGLEAEAVAYYERALRNGLSGDERKGAMLGLGSTYRCLERHAESVALLQTACSEYPDDRSLRVFLALSLFDHGRQSKALSLLLEELLATSADESIQKYRKALTYYADELNDDLKT